MLIQEMDEPKLINLIFSISCKNETKDFKNCFIKTNTNYLMTLKLSKIILVCSKEMISCPFIQNVQNLTIEKFLGKCYYIFHLNKYVNFDEMNKFCLSKNLSIISITSKEQARYFFNRIVIEKFKNIDEKFENSLKKFIQIQNDIFLPLSNFKYSIKN